MEGIILGKDKNTQGNSRINFEFLVLNYELIWNEDFLKGSFNDRGCL
jgi:hypothetical protein